MDGTFDDLPSYQKPTFHEPRSHGIKIYKDVGSNTQILARHRNCAMTNNYKHRHEIKRNFTVF